MNISGLAADPVLKWNGASTSLTSIPTSSVTGPKDQDSTNSATHCPGHLHSNSAVSPVVVGASIGAPLLVLSLVALATTFWYRRKWIQAQRAVSNKHGHISETSDGSMTPSGIQPVRELHAKRAYPAQLDESQPALYEMGGHSYR